MQQLWNVNCGRLTCGVVDLALSRGGAGMTRAAVYLPDRCGASERRGGPGRLGEIELDVLEVESAQVVLPEAHGPR